VDKERVEQDIELDLQVIKEDLTSELSKKNINLPSGSLELLKCIENVRVLLWKFDEHKSCSSVTEDEFIGVIKEDRSLGFR